MICDGGPASGQLWSGKEQPRDKESAREGAKNTSAPYSVIQNTQQQERSQRPEVTTLVPARTKLMQPVHAWGLARPRKKRWAGACAAKPGRPPGREVKKQNAQKRERAGCGCGYHHQAMGILRSSRKKRSILRSKIRNRRAGLAGFAQKQGNRGNLGRVETRQRVRL